MPIVLLLDMKDNQMWDSNMWKIHQLKYYLS